VLASILANDKNVILYRKELNEITGSVTATILLQQIIYWGQKTGGEFYKFIAPCKHEKYKSGDSWVEELGFSRREFSTAYNKLEELGLVSKKTDITRLTTYFVDMEKIEKSLKSLYLRKQQKRIYIDDKSAPAKTTKPHLDLYTETTAETTTDIKKPMPSSANIDHAAKKPDSKKWQTEAAKQLIDYLNQKTGRHYRHTASNIRPITARLSEGYAPDDVARVIERKCAEWINDPQMSQYLRPSTLFNATKFNDYVGQIDTPLPEKRGGQGNGLAWDDTSWMEGMENDPF